LGQLITPPYGLVQYTVVSSSAIAYATVVTGTRVTGSQTPAWQAPPAQSCAHPPQLWTSVATSTPVLVDLIVAE